MALKKMNLEIPWFKKWFDENYLLLYSHRDCEDAEKQVQLIIHTFNPKKNAKLLDLGCGDGRYLYLFNKRGFQTFGLDLSERLLRKGMEKYKNPNVILGDMRAIPGHFDIILSLFTSFGYFEIERENEKVLDSVSESLNKGGWFWLDFLNPTVVKKNLVKESMSFHKTSG